MPNLLKGNLVRLGIWSWAYPYSAELVGCGVPDSVPGTWRGRRSIAIIDAT
jgi:hypothetical protein